jgi:hypothetical protein
MNATDQKVLIATLWQRSSGKGNEYLSGFLGNVRITGFRGEPGMEQEARGGYDGQPRHSASAPPPLRSASFSGRGVRRPRSLIWAGHSSMTR